MLAVHPSIKPKINHSSRKMRKWSQDGNLLEGEEILAVYPSNPKINHSSRKNKKIVAGWKTPRRGRDPSFPSINQTRKSIIHQGKREKWPRDGNLLEKGKRS